MCGGYRDEISLSRVGQDEVGELVPGSENAVDLAPVTEDEEDFLCCCERGLERGMSTVVEREQNIELFLSVDAVNAKATRG